MEENKSNLFIMEKCDLFKEYARFPVILDPSFDMDVFCDRYGHDFTIPRELANHQFYSRFKGSFEKTAIILECNKRSDIHDYYNFVADHKYQHANAPGLLMAWEQGAKYFPRDTYVDGLDHEENLFKDNGLNRILRININDRGTLFVLGYLGLPGKYILVYK
jgi:hypothetical protein